VRYTLSMAFSVTYTDPAQLSDRQLLLLLLERLDTLMATATDTKTALNALDAKVDQFLAAVQPVVTTLQQALTAAQAQISALQAGDTAAAATLGETVDAAVAETVKVQAAIDALTPPSTP
jgi:hypothetical protein